jgi:hypothetical protein
VVGKWTQWGQNSDCDHFPRSAWGGSDREMDQELRSARSGHTNPASHGTDINPCLSWFLTRWVNGTVTAPASSGATGRHSGVAG